MKLHAVKIGEHNSASDLFDSRPSPKAELTVVGRLIGKLAEENAETKGGTKRNNDVPGKAFNYDATGREVDEVEAFRGRDPAAVDD